MSKIAHESHREQIRRQYSLLPPASISGGTWRVVGWSDVVVGSSLSTALHQRARIARRRPPLPGGLLGVLVATEDPFPFLGKFPDRQKIRQYRRRLRFLHGGFLQVLAATAAPSKWRPVRRSRRFSSSGPSWPFVATVAPQVWISVACVPPPARQLLARIRSYRIGTSAACPHESGRA